MDEKGKRPGEGKKKIVLPPYGLAEDILESLGEGPDPIEMEEEKSSAEIKIVTFFMDREEYGLPIDRVREINRVGEITRVPNSARHVLGVINLRGKIIPAIELKKRLGLGPSVLDKASRIVVAETGQKLMGLLVDSVSEVMNVRSEEIEMVSEDLVEDEKSFIKGVVKLEERIIILIDLDGILKS